jgi:uncharacterized protein
MMEKTIAQKNAQRGRMLRGLRKIHGWLGLWGAVLGLLFGITGFLLNHRAVMKIPASQMEAHEIQLQMSQPYPADAKAFARFVQQALDIQQDPVKPKQPKGEGKEKGMGSAERDAHFLGKGMMQPPVWKVEFQLPQASIKAEYIPGNQYATVERSDANVWGFLMRMHKGVGANAGWVLLADSIAGALMLLSITGVLLWTKMRGSRLVMAGLVGGSILATVWATLAIL